MVVPPALGPGDERVQLLLREVEGGEPCQLVAALFVHGDRVEGGKRQGDVGLGRRLLDRVEGGEAFRELVGPLVEGRECLWNVVRSLDEGGEALRDGHIIFARCGPLVERGEGSGELC